MYLVPSNYSDIPYKQDVTNKQLHTANVNCKITDKLRYLSVIFKQTHLFLNIFESCYNYRQMSVKIKIKSHIQQKTEKILSV